MAGDSRIAFANTATTSPPPPPPSEKNKHQSIKTNQ